MHRSAFLFLAIAVTVRMAAALSSVTSNGFTHTVYQDAANRCLWHVSDQGGVKDTHLVRFYKPYFLAANVTMDVVTPGVWQNVPTWRDGSAGGGGSCNPSALHANLAHFAVNVVGRIIDLAVDDP
jgi:hypothetical protein